MAPWWGDNYFGCGNSGASCTIVSKYGFELLTGRSLWGREDFKRRQFQEVGLADAVFVPFVMEATGRLGGAARRWIDITFGRAHQRVLKSMLKSISMRIAKMNSRMIEAGR